MRKIRHKGFVPVVAVLTVVALLAPACSSDDATDAEPSTESTTSDTEAVNRDGTLHITYDLTQSGNFTFDPTTAPSGSSMDPLWYLVYGRLLRKLSDGNLVGDLAESAKVTDPNTIEVKVRAGQTWQDGTPFDAAAVKAGLDRNLASGNVGMFTEPFFKVRSVDVVDPLTVRISFPEGNAPSWFDSFISATQTTITPATIDTNAPIGAGPMKVGTYRPGEALTLERYEDFWNASEVGFAGIEMVSVEQAQPQATLATLQAGQSDMATLPTDQLPGLSGDLEEVVVPDPTRMVQVGFCKRDEPLSDPDVRRAISNAIDRDAINDAVFAGTTEPAVQLWPEGDRFYNPEVGDVLDYDPEAAKQALADAGQPNPQFDMYLLNALSVPDVGQVVQQQLKQVGITANLKVSADFVGEFMRPKLAGATIFPPVPNPGAKKLVTLVGLSLSNLCDYVNPELDALAAELATVSSDTQEAQDIWWEIDKIIADETLVIPLLFGSLTGGYDSSKVDLGGTYPDGLWVFPDIYTSSMVG